MSPKDTLYFPDRLLIQFVEDEKSDLISKIVVTLTIFAQSKNDYHLGPSPSNSEGRILIKQNWIRNAIDHLRNSFIMDYSSALEQCLSEICITVMSTDEINRAISAMKLYGIEQGNEEIAHSISDLENASNKKYEPQEVFVKFDKPGEMSREITIKLRRSLLQI